MKPLTPTMRNCIKYAQDHGDELVRQPGGFWVREGDKGLRGTTWFGTSTIEALVQRGQAEYTEWQLGRSGRFPIRMKLKGQ